MVAASGEKAEPPDQIAELLRIVGEPPAPPSKFSDGKKAQPAGRRHQGRRRGDGEPLGLRLPGVVGLAQLSRAWAGERRHAMAGLFTSTFMSIGAAPLEAAL